MDGISPYKSTKLTTCLTYSLQHFKSFFFKNDSSSNISKIIISNTRDSVSSHSINTEKRVENMTRSGAFLTKFEVFGMNEIYMKTINSKPHKRAYHP